MKLWTTRFKPFVPFHVERREAIQRKWDFRRNNGNRAGREIEPIILGDIVSSKKLTKVG
jgi:hypothetical protein